MPPRRLAPRRDRLRMAVCEGRAVFAERGAADVRSRAPAGVQSLTGVCAAPTGLRRHGEAGGRPDDAAQPQEVHVARGHPAPVRLRSVQVRSGHGPVLYRFVSCLAAFREGDYCKIGTGGDFARSYSGLQSSITVETPQMPSPLILVVSLFHL